MAYTDTQNLQSWSLPVRHNWLSKARSWLAQFHYEPRTNGSFNGYVPLSKVEADIYRRLSPAPGGQQAMINLYFDHKHR